MIYAWQTQTRVVTPAINVLWGRGGVIAKIPVGFVAGQVYIPGFKAARAYVPGVQAGQAYIPGFR